MTRGWLCRLFVALLVLLAAPPPDMELNVSVPPQVADPCWQDMGCWAVRR